MFLRALYICSAKRMDLTDCNLSKKMLKQWLL